MDPLGVSTSRVRGDGHDEGPPPVVAINLRPLGSPLPLGLFSFGIGMLLLAAQGAGWVGKGEDSQVGLILVAFVFPLEALAAILAFLARDTLSGTVLGYFTTSWATLGLSFIISPPGARSDAQGFFLIGFSAVVVALAVVGLGGKPLISLTLSLSAARALLDGIYQLSGTTSIDHAAGYVAAVIAGVAWYAGTAMLVEDVRQRSMLPVFRRGAGRVALEGDLRAQLTRAQGEAGVRQQL